MADINAYLREAINGPAPQHKVAGRNQFEISEGSDGATHTKIVDVDGNPLSSVPVEDKAVKAELAEIKQTQAQILERMDETFDARLTGSNVEEEFFERFIFNGTNKQYRYKFPENDYRGAIVSVIVHGATGDYSNGKGFRPRLLNYSYGNMSANNALQISPEYTKSDNATYQFYIYPGIDLGDAGTRNNNTFFYKSGLMVPEHLALFLDLDGDVGTGEGFDISANIMWLK